MHRARVSGAVRRYRAALRDGAGIYSGLAANVFYVIFRIAAGIRYASVWFISLAAYYLVLAGLRACLAVCRRRRSPAREIACYRRTAWLLFLLNVPMGGIIALTVRTNSGFSYPGHIIYLSALYAFYAMTQSIVQLVRSRRVDSPVLSAARVVNFVSAMMSIFGLQTAMISRFSPNSGSYRQMMNAITGSCVWGIVILLAVSMLLRGKALAREEKPREQVGKQIF